MRIDFFQFVLLASGWGGRLTGIATPQTGINATVDSLEALNPLDGNCPRGPSLIETKIETCLLLIPSSTWKLLSVILRNQPAGAEETFYLLGHDVSNEITCVLAPCR